MAGRQDRYQQRGEKGMEHRPAPSAAADRTGRERRAPGRIGHPSTTPGGPLEKRERSERGPMRRGAEAGGYDRDPLHDLAEDVARIAAENALLLQRLAEGERRLRLISRSVLRVQEEERARISRELHDEVGQALTALKIQVGLAEEVAAREQSALVPRLAELREMTDRTLQDVRQISHLLRPQMLDELGLVPTLKWLVRAFRQRTGIAVEFVCEGLEAPVDPEVETVIFRVVQEALTNMAKHARTPSAQVRVHRAGNRVLLLVQDHGVGFDATRVLESEDEGCGLGLRGMRDRVRLFAGQFALRSSPGNGTVIEVEVPLEPEGSS